MILRIEINGATSEENLQSEGGGAESSHKRSNPSFQRVISHKAFQFGVDSGVTAEFIVKQAAMSMAPFLADLDIVFSALQSVILPQVFQGRVPPLTPT